MTHFFVLATRTNCLRICLPVARLYHAGRARSVNTAIAQSLRKSKGPPILASKSSDHRQKPGSGYGNSVRERKDGFSSPSTARSSGSSSRDSISSRVNENRGRGVVIRRGIKPIKSNRDLARKKPNPAGPKPIYGKNAGKLRHQRTLLDEEEPRSNGFGGTPNSRSNERRSRDSKAEPKRFQGRNEDFRDRNHRDDSSRREWAPRPMELQSGSAKRTGGRRVGAPPPIMERIPKRSPMGSPSSIREHGLFPEIERQARSIDEGPAKRTATSADDVPKLSIRWTNETPRDENAPSSGPRIKKAIDSRIPLSIPYTTPASEFLYGTSVVEAALTSQRVPRRQCYKLYVYTGENRERISVDRDADLEILAQKNNVKVSQVHGDGLRLMDKMSGGRPHNGYILEASPLPRLPITRLGGVIDEVGRNGFEVTVDHQSREDAAINGTADFIHLPRSRSGKQPMILLLDSIKDPGNLGGIIRSASFLGVSAVAISTRNSASFTPVVLKASAGASENMTLFSINKPEGFIQDSREAGWKIFAAVAPSTSEDAYRSRKLISTDDLEDSLKQTPCILMLGGEGEGLRPNLKRKADSEVYIPGHTGRANVDSLNVSVAAGMLCKSFLGRSDGRASSSAAGGGTKDRLKSSSDLF
ncbi:hypothetical protein BJ875DRAFT_451958 [Amylocarpus encephaloides]|uniref:rRNA methyltransferase 1, mitochondrial n=1 Tax=Amylocarpus encephaloides TaxID=45428 RepID=A0A9P7YQI9_9HELO|nr:hypothetical protein BJ875DRAFT_451958 [Amylocarpus encephaloides]